MNPLRHVPTPAQERRRLAALMARQGYGWDDIVVRSRSWRLGEIPRDEAIALVCAHHRRQDALRRERAA